MQTGYGMTRRSLHKMGIKILKKILILILVFAFAKKSNAQHTPLTDRFKMETISQLTILLNDNYIFPAIAEQTTIHLNKKVSEGWLNTIPSIDSFSKALTTEIYSISTDKHIRLRPSKMPLPARLTDIGVKGFKEAKVLDGNIGYIDIRLFVPGAESVIDSIMKIIEPASAVIIDVRNNAGGFPEMVQYLCSYFISKKILLNSLYNRTANTSREFWTVAVKGKPLPDVPVYILTSSATFSAGEEFCYDMQTQKRATIIGETTGGGANPGRVFNINAELDIFIPLSRAINPVTGTNWEGVGVKPDIIVPSKDAYAKAIEMIMKMK